MLDPVHSRPCGCRWAGGNRERSDCDRLGSSAERHEPRTPIARRSFPALSAVDDNSLGPAYPGLTVPPLSQVLFDHALPLRPTMKSVMGPYAPHFPFAPRWKTLFLKTMFVALLESPL